METGQRWRVVAELTFDPVEEEDDWEALERAKAKLNTLLDGEPFIHFHVLQRVQPIWD